MGLVRQYIIICILGTYFTLNRPSYEGKICFRKASLLDKDRGSHHLFR